MDPQHCTNQRRWAHWRLLICTGGGRSPRNEGKAGNSRRSGEKNFFPRNYGHPTDGALGQGLCALIAALRTWCVCVGVCVHRNCKCVFRQALHGICKIVW
jgi:hypothetical protein